MEQHDNLLNRIRERMDTFSKGQRRIAEFILSQYDKAAYITAAKLGATVGVSESTVVRFASELGYDGYPGMQRELRAMIRTRLTAAQRVGVASDRIAKGDILQSVLEADMENLRASLAEIDKDEFEQIAEAVVNAKTVYIIGVRSSASLAMFLSFYLNLICGNVRHVQTSTASELFEQIFRIGEGDVLIGISFPRYSKRTLKAIHYAKSRNATVISITDSKASPIAQAADMPLIARSDMASFVDSLVAPLSVINALIVAISMKKQSEVVATFEKLEKIWDEYQVYEKFDTEGN
ncbi:MAG TPA: MurR/RpiR family transcriptional regulator [Candidatus Aphodoplasma excrementigallinarum]|uniref:MurR/RpiR family transcriptional regulator n=1 Tax=Candidatus Aphodoplasma excrementigallinarum TaxID=2840673 RepID=A0A9D1NI90_9FIRM|nr:MurR/RpiR family transcriptional regulator [Candidatus Aphodoplasma excrementigallinarum]